MTKYFVAALSILITSAALGLGSCQAQERSPATRDFMGREDVRGSPPVNFEGQLWTGPAGIGGVLKPIARDNMMLVDGALSASMFGLTWQGQPVAAITNTFEMDCEEARYRKVNETWLSANSEPMTRLETPTSEWLDGSRQPMMQWACGNTSVQPVGPHFSNVSEFVSLYDAEAERRSFRPQVSGPTIARPQD